MHKTPWPISLHTFRQETNTRMYWTLPIRNIVSGLNLVSYPRNWVLLILKNYSVLNKGNSRMPPLLHGPEVVITSFKDKAEVFEIVDLIMLVVKFQNEFLPVLSHFTIYALLRVLFPRLYSDHYGIRQATKWIEFHKYCKFFKWNFADQKYI